MPTLSDFRIELDRSVLAYAPGETVSGRVVFYVSAPKKFREIKIKIRGKAKVHWEEFNGRWSDEYSKKEHYFKVLHKIFGEKTGDGQPMLLAGQHSYPFFIRLPVTIPCSFEHKYGHIRYSVKAILDKSLFSVYKFFTPFMVLAPYDLSIQQKFAAPINEDIEEKFFDFCCFNARSMKFNVSCRTRGFYPGETIELIIRYDDSSTGVNVRRMRLILQKQITFYTSSNKKRKKETLREVNRTGSLGNKGETSLKLVVPSVPPSNLQGCSIIDVNYKLDLLIEISGMYSNVTRSYPVQLWDTFADTIINYI